VGFCQAAVLSAIPFSQFPVNRRGVLIGNSVLGFHTKVYRLIPVTNSEIQASGCNLD